MPQFSLRKKDDKNSLSSGSPLPSSSPLSSSSPSQRGRSESLAEMKLSADNIEKIEKIGEGAFGEVW